MVRNFPPCRNGKQHLSNLEHVWRYSEWFQGRCERIPVLVQLPTQSWGACPCVQCGGFCYVLSLRQLILVCFFAALRGQNPGSSQSSDLSPSSPGTCHSPIKKPVTQPIIFLHALVHAQSWGTWTAHGTGNLHTSTVSLDHCETQWQLVGLWNLEQILLTL